jgi:chromosome segregation ATPase
MENVTQANFDALGQVIDAIRGKQTMLAELDRALDAKQATIAAKDDELREKGAYAQALETHVGELTQRLQDLRRELAPEEVLAQTRVAELKAEKAQLTEQVFRLTGQVSQAEAAERAKARRDQVPWSGWHAQPMSDEQHAQAHTRDLRQAAREGDV